MPQEILRQSNWNNGELDPEMLGRRDLKAYYASAALMENCVFTPAGPLERRPGLTFVDYVRRELQAVALDEATITAPSGGDPTKVTAADGALLLTAADMGVTDPYVVLVVDFGAPVRVGVIDVIDYAVSPDGSSIYSAPWGYPWGFDPYGLGGGPYP